MKQIFKLWAYYGLIYVLGLTLLSALIFGLTHLRNQTISDNMLTYPIYRIIISSCIILQLSMWCVCLYSKGRVHQETAVWGYFVMIVMLVNWIGLTSILNGVEHAAFVSLFMCCFLTLMLIFCSVIWQEDVRYFMQVGLAILSGSALAGIVLFNNNEFYLLEHISFIIYSLIFTFFFTIHPFYEWDSLPEDLQQFEEDSAWNSTQTINPLLKPHHHLSIHNTH